MHTQWNSTSTSNPAAALLLLLLLALAWMMAEENLIHIDKK